MKLTEKEARALGLPVPGPQKPRQAPRDDEADRRADEMHKRLFLASCEAHGLPVPVEEYQFAPPRRWRFDWLFDGWLALEIQGGCFVAGRHVRGSALIKEWEKLNEAVCLGYSVLFCCPQDVEDGSIFSVIRRALDSVEEVA